MLSLSVCAHLTTIACSFIPKQKHFCPFREFWDNYNNKQAVSEFKFLKLVHQNVIKLLNNPCGSDELCSGQMQQELKFWQFVNLVFTIIPLFPLLINKSTWSGVKSWSRPPSNTFPQTVQPLSYRKWVQKNNIPAANSFPHEKMNGSLFVRRWRFKSISYMLGHIVDLHGVWRTL